MSKTNPNGGMRESGNTSYSPLDISELSLRHADSLINKLNEEYENDITH